MKILKFTPQSDCPKCGKKCLSIIDNDFTLLCPKCGTEIHLIEETINDETLLAKLKMKPNELTPEQIINQLTDGIIDNLKPKIMKAVILSLNKTTSTDETEEFIATPKIKISANFQRVQ